MAKMDMLQSTMVVLFSLFGLFNNNKFLKWFIQVLLSSKSQHQSRLVDQITSKKKKIELEREVYSRF